MKPFRFLAGILTYLLFYLLWLWQCQSMPASRLPEWPPEQKVMLRQVMAKRGPGFTVIRTEHESYYIKTRKGRNAGYVCKN